VNLIGRDQNSTTVPCTRPTSLLKLPAQLTQLLKLLSGSFQNRSVFPGQLPDLLCYLQASNLTLSHRSHGAKRSSVRQIQTQSSEQTLICYSFNQELLVDTTPMPSHIPKVTEIGASSAPLMSASFFIGARCKAYNDDYMQCKTEAYGRGELDCMKEGRKVTRCAASV